MKRKSLIYRLLNYWKSLSVSLEKMRAGVIARSSLSLPLSFYVGITGFEPVTSALSRQRSKPTELNALNYLLKDIKGLLFSRIFPPEIISLPILSWP